MKRNDYKGDGTGGLWDIPGGGVELFEDCNLSVKREVLEEACINVLDCKVFSVDSGKGKDDGQVIFVMYYSNNFEIVSDEIKLSHEHSEYKWISAEEISDYDFYVWDSRLNAIRELLKELD